jgi:predicted RNA binding protein YcfA (HicA-like mRNA interferase family)
MKLPRDVSGEDLIKLLRQLGYTITRQVGSHIRLTRMQNGQHHVTMPNHSPLKIGTLSAIISDIAVHFNKTKEEMINTLWR